METFTNPLPAPDNPKLKFTTEHLAFIYLGDWLFNDFKQVAGLFALEFKDKRDVGTILSAFAEKYSEKAQQTYRERAKQYQWYSYIAALSKPISLTTNLKVTEKRTIEKAFLVLHQRHGLENEHLSKAFNREFSTQMTSQQINTRLGRIEKHRQLTHELLEKAKAFHWYAPDPTPGSPDWEKFEKARRKREGRVRQELKRERANQDQPPLELEFSEGEAPKEHGQKQNDKQEDTRGKEGASLLSLSSTASTSSALPGSELSLGNVNSIHTAARLISAPPTLPGSAMPLSLSIRRRAPLQIDTTTEPTDTSRARRTSTQTPFSAISTRSQSPAVSEELSEDGELRSDGRAIRNKYRDRRD
ncbi:hypothetical protein MMC20_006053 [Loxospora ochrophaea]|nr:hypothetical protein [Loxospora ochrophaea]